jgi:NhaA family Na+:H+ antiporter
MQASRWRASIPTMLLHPVTSGVALGLFVGKQLGVFGAVLIAVRLGWARRPAHATWVQVYGVALLCGVGFTMSLFIGLLAFANAPQHEAATKIGVLAGSMLCTAAGALVLRLGSPRSDTRKV